MAVVNLHGFQGLTSIDASIEESTAALCSRLEMVTVVIGLSLPSGRRS